MQLAGLVKIERTAAEDLHETLLRREGSEELFLTATARPGETTRELLTRIGRRAQQHGARITAMTVFNGRTGREVAAAHLQRMFDGIDWPINWLESESSPCDAPAGVELHAFKGPSIQTLRLNNRVVGCAWEDAAARHCELGDLRDETTSHPACLQAQHVLEQMSSALHLAGMTFSNVYRTWFRNHNILDWYKDFNRVRTDFYARHHILDGLLPASTGISAFNPFHAALVASLWALQPKCSTVRAYTVDSPLQDSACKYGSSFSRAVEVDMGDHRRLTISGTASIDPAGKTAHVGDVAAQVDLTMRVVRSILISRGMDWTDVSRGLVYFRRPEDLPFYDRWRRVNEAPLLPVVITNHTVCREDLLYEIELDALSH